jgi:hypothetical protein
MTTRIDLPPEKEAALRAQAEAVGLSAEDFATETLYQALAARQSAGGTGGSETPVSELIREIWADMPADVRRSLPSDGASEHDHYIYGWPKKRT